MMVMQTTAQAVAVEPIAARRLPVALIVVLLERAQHLTPQAVANQRLICGSRWQRSKAQHIKPILLSEARTSIAQARRDSLPEMQEAGDSFPRL